VPSSSGSILINFGTFIPPWQKFKNYSVVEIGHLNSQPLTNRHLHFLIIVVSATPETPLYRPKQSVAKCGAWGWQCISTHLTSDCSFFFSLRNLHHSCYCLGRWSNCSGYWGGKRAAATLCVTSLAASVARSPILQWYGEVSSPLLYNNLVERS
jgi:hypothetical protein